MEYRIDYINKEGVHRTAYIEAESKYEAERKVEEGYDVYDIISIRQQ